MNFDYMSVYELERLASLMTGQLTARLFYRVIFYKVCFSQYVCVYEKVLACRIQVERGK